MMPVRTAFGVIFLPAIFLAASALPTGLARGGTVATWDFTKGRLGWRGNQYTTDLTTSREGLTFRSTGLDPWIEGPPVDLPGTGITRVRVRMKSQADGHGELFYGAAFRAGHSVRFTVDNDGRWHDYTLLIREPLGAGTRFRLDPATGEGSITVASIAVETIPAVTPPPFAPPKPADAGTGEAASVESGNLVLLHHLRGWGDFVVQVDGRPMASGYRNDLIGVILDGQVESLELAEAEFSDAVDPQDDRLTLHATLRDREGTQWRITRRFEAGDQSGTVSVETTIAADRNRQVVHLPWLTLFPGLGTFGRHKTQGLFAGLEYLADEPSSSEADITTPEHVRRVPDPVKITFPLMAIAHDGSYVALRWQPSTLVAATFDSPDRIYDSGAHVMALTGPAVGEHRFENDPVAHTPVQLEAGQSLTGKATILGGRGRSIVPAVRKYVEREGLPDVPRFEGGLDEAVELLAHGWLDSAIREDGLFRHAVWGDRFGAGPASDAPMYMDWLASRADGPGLVDRLLAGRDRAVTRWPKSRPYARMVSHVRTPTAPLVFGGVAPYVERRRADAESLLARFDEQGIREYQPGEVDYGSTHFANHANGQAATEVATILEAATLSGDRALIEKGLALLDKQTALYANTVPRGAQTWEVPLHTPDVLASAHLVNAYTLGYAISGRREHLEQARYWAWTGVPFVYLDNPTEGEIGPYATIAVLGATNWRAPVWFGLPVQWCGLVYASALHRLSEYDPDGPWETVARGITATGLQMTWPTEDEDRQGLLPDLFVLDSQHRDGPAINPGTVQATVPELFDEGTLYAMKKLPTTGCFLHAPCAIRALRETDKRVTFTVDGWDARTFYVLLSGVHRNPDRITFRTDPGESLQPATSHFHAQQGLLTITLTGQAEVHVDFHQAAAP